MLVSKTLLLEKKTSAPAKNYPSLQPTKPPLSKSKDRLMVARMSDLARMSTSTSTTTSGGGKFLKGNDIERIAITDCSECWSRGSGQINHFWVDEHQFNLPSLTAQCPSPFSILLLLQILISHVRVTKFLLLSGPNQINLWLNAKQGFVYLLSALNPMKLPIMSKLCAARVNESNQEII